MTDSLTPALTRASARLARPGTPAVSVVIHVLVFPLWVTLFLLAWSAAAACWPGRSAWPTGATTPRCRCSPGGRSDGSTDATTEMLCGNYGFAVLMVGEVSGPVRVGSTALRWLRLPHGGKSAALNAGLLRTDVDVILTVDADTVLDHGAIKAVRQAFTRDSQLVAVTGGFGCSATRRPARRRRRRCGRSCAATTAGWATPAGPACPPRPPRW
ncbi:Glycosyl transferase family 2 (fragment) [uncultured Mycobacterium sp.]|uniref:Glycosyl transferase family 2 n=1 Tax=uncultured Mycobacterium sp. TaxID=171292 RepID=A0A1Y5PT57_9MYCO